MGAFLDKPKTEKKHQKGDGKDFRFDVAYMQGWRVEMEDAHTAEQQMSEEFKRWSFFAIFDGHAGSMTANQCAKKLMENHVKSFIKEKIPNDKKLVDIEHVKKIIEGDFINFDKELSKGGNAEYSDDRSGTTATVAFITPFEYIFANCGDSRGMLVSNSIVKFATVDHKPTTTDEKARIEKAGGSVIFERVNGSLAVSRAFGDFDYKSMEKDNMEDQVVSARPDVEIIDRCAKKDQFIILACDGIWDVMTNEDVKNFILYKLKITEKFDESILDDLLNTCLHKGSRDNMSAALIVFNDGAPKFDKNMAEKEKKLREKVKSETLAYFESQKDSSDVPLTKVMSELEPKFPPEDLPLGGGFDYLKEQITQLHFEKYGAAKNDDDSIDDDVDEPSQNSSKTPSK